MSANLDMIVDATTGKKTARMLYKRKYGVPWHGNGFPIDRNMTVEEIADMLQLEDLAKVNLLLAMEGNPVLGGYSAIVRPSDKKIFAVMSSEYQIHQPLKILEFFREFLDRAEMEMDTVGLLDGGGKMWAQAKINKVGRFKDDILEGRFLMATSFDGSLATTGRTTSHRPVCENTLMPALASKGKREVYIKHNAQMTAEVIEQAKKAMGLAQEQFSKLLENAEQLASVKVPANAGLFFAHALSDKKFLDSIVTVQEGWTRGEALLDTILKDQETVSAVSLTVNDLSRVGEAILDEILNGPGCELESSDETAWGLVNGVTAYVDHVAGRNRDTALNAAWFGQGAKLKDEALVLATELATAIQR